MPAAAQQTASGQVTNFLNPFPEGETWRAGFVGDYLAEGLAQGLAEGMASEARLQFQRRHRPFAGLARADIEDDARGIEDFAVREKLHIVFIMTGMADRGGVRLPNGQRVPVGEGDWRTLYGAKVDRVVRSLRRRGVAVYWVGLPIMRRGDWNDDIEQMNEVIRERVLNNGGRYIDAFKLSSDENGQFNDRGPDISGKWVRLRDPDGYGFTQAGFRKIAFFIERDLRRDMNSAREERAIPLAGSEAEQKRINPEGLKEPAREGPAGVVGAAGAAQVTAREARAQQSPVARALSDKSAPSPGQPTAAPQAGDLKADTQRVPVRLIGASGQEEQVTIEIVRPALSQSVIQIMTRRDSGEKASQVGDTLTDTLSNGVLVMRSVTPAQRAAGDRSASRAALTQQPFFIALNKGERLPPKPGRADDFRWPREDDIPPPPQAPVAASAAAGAEQAAPATKGRPRPAPQRPPVQQRPSAPPPSSVFNQ